MSPEEEKAFFKGEGELIVKRTRHKGLATKAASWLVLGPVGYIAFGRDKKQKTRAKGTLVVTNKAIYCAGNEYPFDKVISLTQQGMISKSIVLTLEKSYTEPGGLTGGLSYEIEIKTGDVDKLFKALEEARLSKVKF